MAGWAGSPAFLPAMNFVSVNLHDLSRAEFDALMAAWGYKPLHGARLWSHVHRRGATSWAEMENLPKALRARLAAEAVMPLLPVARETHSSDGFTRKYLLRLADGFLI